MGAYHIVREKISKKRRNVVTVSACPLLVLQLWHLLWYVCTHTLTTVTSCCFDDSATVCSQDNTAALHSDRPKYYCVAYEMMSSERT